MRRLLFAIVAAIVFLVRSAAAQPKACHWQEMKATPQNLSFSEGTAGSAPTAWLLGPEWIMPPHMPVYEALIAEANQCHGSAQCATVHSLRSDPSIARNVIVAGGNVRRPEPVEMPVKLGIASSSPSFSSLPFSCILVASRLGAVKV
jgi:hypothetical protein